MAGGWRFLVGVIGLGLASACGGESDIADSSPPPPPPPPPPGEDRVLPDTISLVEFMAGRLDGMPGRDSGGYVAPDADERIAMVAIFEEARGGRVARADSMAAAYGYDVEATIDATHGDTLIVILEQTPIRRGWGTYVVRRGAAPLDVHINHPLFDQNTPRVGAGLFDACRCRALLMGGTHRYANDGNEADMARSTTSVFQGIHEALATDAVMAMSVHGFARTNYDEPIASADAVLSPGGDAGGRLVEAFDAARQLRDALRDAGFVAGLVIEDDGYDQLTATSNPQGRHSNATRGPGAWIHVEVAREVRVEPTRWRPYTEVIAEWALGLE